MVSGVAFEKEFKVQVEVYRLVAWRLSPSGQRCSMTEKIKVQLGERGLQETETVPFSIGWHMTHDMVGDSMPIRIDL